MIPGHLIWCPIPHQRTTCFSKATTKPTSADVFRTRHMGAAFQIEQDAAAEQLSLGKTGIWVSHHKERPLHSSCRPACALQVCHQKWHYRSRINVNGHALAVCFWNTRTAPMRPARNTAILTGFCPASESRPESAFDSLESASPTGKRNKTKQNSGTGTQGKVKDFHRSRHSSRL